MTVRSLCFVHFLVLAAACSSGGGGIVDAPATERATGDHDGGTEVDRDGDRGSATTDAGSSKGGTNDGGGSSTSGALKIVSLTSTVASITGGEPLQTESKSVTFVAIVTDTAGLDTIAGGQLMDENGATYAAFGAGANKGTYTATVDFVLVNSVRAAEFGPTGTKRKFVAKFFDNDGNEAKADVEIALACRLAGEPAHACGGACTDVANNAKHCGACGKSCGACIESGCYDLADDPTSVTAVQSNCFAPSTVPKGMTCKSLCTSAGRGCLGMRVYSAASCGGSAIPVEDCNEDLSSTPEPSVRCRCIK